jgi:hypothetical protein
LASWWLIRVVASTRRSYARRFRPGNAWIVASKVFCDLSRTTAGGILPRQTGLVGASRARGTNLPRNLIRAIGLSDRRVWGLSLRRARSVVFGEPRSWGRDDKEV